mmetsp:Transcript_11932/g.38094  ORF Transcript_11932/g.38094 Transcript_11932/m.38094 type:complete len:144 (-) Transcript_11932:285-716(-)
MAASEARGFEGGGAVGGVGEGGRAEEGVVVEEEGHVERGGGEVGEAPRAGEELGGEGGPVHRRERGGGRVGVKRRPADRREGRGLWRGGEDLFRKLADSSLVSMADTWPPSPMASAAPASSDRASDVGSTKSKSEPDGTPSTP